MNNVNSENTIEIQDMELSEREQRRKLELQHELCRRIVSSMPSKFSNDDERITTSEGIGASDENFLERFYKIKNANIQDAYGWGFLHFAVARNNIEIVDALLKNGADVNLKDIDGETPLYLAVQFRRLEIAKKLLENGANINVVDKLGNRLLYIAKIKEDPELNKILDLENIEKENNIYENKVIENKRSIEMEKCTRNRAFMKSLDRELEA